MIVNKNSVMPHKERIKVLHALGCLGRGGAETWLVQTLRCMDRDRFKVDVVINRREAGVYEDEVKGMGCRVFVCRSPSQPLRYGRNFLRILSENGPYDIVHSHLHYFSGFIMRLACYAGVPVRIAHSRNSADARRPTISRRLYRALMRRWLIKNATLRMAVSRQAGLGIFGARYGSEAECHIMTGIDFSPFLEPRDRAAVRKELGLADQVRVIGHVGSFIEQKNHGFFLDTALFLASQEPDVYFLLVGAGPLKSKVQDRARQSRYPERFIFLGDRSDVPRLLSGAVDVFFFPSLFEGLPRALLEAQAAGLPCVASSAISREAEALPGGVTFLELSEGPEKWGRAVREALDKTPSPERGEASIRAFSQRGLTIQSNANRIMEIYERALSQ